MYMIVNVSVPCSVPANTKRDKNVIITSKQRFDVIITCLLRCVFARVIPSAASLSGDYKIEVSSVFKY